MAKDSMVRDIWIVLISLAVGFVLGLNWDSILQMLQKAMSSFHDTGWN